MSRPVRALWGYIEIDRSSHWGRISEARIAGVPLVRVEVPVDDEFEVYDYPAAELVRIRHMTEEDVREAERRRLAGIRAGLSVSTGTAPDAVIAGNTVNVDEAPF